MKLLYKVLILNFHRNYVIEIKQLFSKETLFVFYNNNSGKFDNEINVV